MNDNQDTVGEDKESTQIQEWETKLKDRTRKQVKEGPRTTQTKSTGPQDTGQTMDMSNKRPRTQDNVDHKGTKSHLTPKTMTLALYPLFNTCTNQTKDKTPATLDPTYLKDNTIAQYKQTTDKVPSNTEDKAPTIAQDTTTTAKVPPDTEDRTERDPRPAQGAEDKAHTIGQDIPSVLQIPTDTEDKAHTIAQDSPSVKDKNTVAEDKGNTIAQDIPTTDKIHKDTEDSIQRDPRPAKGAASQHPPLSSHHKARVQSVDMYS